MKKVLILLCKKYLNVYYYKKYDFIPGSISEIDLSRPKELAYMAVRNIIGGCLFFFSLMLFILITGSCFLDLKLRLGNYKPIGYAIMLVLILLYIALSKKHLKPLFDGVEPDNLTENEIKKENHFFIASIIGAGIFGSLMFVIARLISIYACR